MPTDNAITRLLYAIISQKCLKDIDWNRVAQDPILSQEITNGHAARMRYSRFKKQMEGTQPSTRKSRPKNRVEKNTNRSSLSTPKRERIKRQPSKDNEGENDDTLRIKSEHPHLYNQHQPHPNFYSDSDRSRGETQTPDLESGHSIHGLPHGMLDPRSLIIKPEPGLSSSNMTPMPTTPLPTYSTPNYGRFAHEEQNSPSPSPGASFGLGHGHVGVEFDDMISSFGVPGSGGGCGGAGVGKGGDYYEREGPYGIGMGAGVGGAGAGEYVGGYWEERGLRDDGSGGMVKSEPRWEETYVRSLEGGRE